MALSSHQWLKAVNQGQVLCSVYSESQAAASCLRPLFLPLFTSVPMATAPPSPERLELGPGLFWLRSKVFSCCVYPELAVTSPNEEWAQWCWTSQGGKEREKWEEERREGQNLGVGRHRVGGGRKAKSITSLLEQSQKGKDMSQWTDCTSLSLSFSSWTAAKPLVFKSPVLELELGLCGLGQ